MHKSRCFTYASLTSHKESTDVHGLLTGKYKLHNYFLWWYRMDCFCTNPSIRQQLDINQNQITHRDHEQYVYFYQVPSKRRNQ